MLVTAAMLAVAASGLRGADYPAHLLRALVWERTGIGAWNTYWYGGHPTPTYSVLAPPATALFGIVVVVGVSSLVATYAFSVLLRELRPGPTTWLANIAFAISAAVNVVVGRAPFALGLAVCLAALLAWHRNRPLIAVTLAAVTPFASPVAAAFLAVAAVSVAIDAMRRHRRGAGLAAGVTAAAGLPVLAMAWLYRSPGWFPFRADQLAFSIAAIGVVFVVQRHPVVRVAALLSAALSIGLFLVPNPLGGNVVRLTQLVAPSLVIVSLPAIGRARARPIAWLVVAGIVWGVQPGVVAALDWLGDDSVEPDYHQPLVDEVARRNQDGRPIGRVEIPFTENHWEAFFVAPAVPYARGWERQVDLERNEVLYDDDLSLSEYRDWLDDNAVRWIAVADVALDEGGRPETDLIERDGTANDIPWLRRVWSNDDWRLYEVLDYQPIVDLPAVLVGQEADRITVRTDQPAVVRIRFRYSDDLRVDGPACLEPVPDDEGAFLAHLREPGVYAFGVELENALPGGDSDRCPDSAADRAAHPASDRAADRAAHPGPDPRATDRDESWSHRAESVPYE